MGDNRARKNLFIKVNIWRFLDKELLARLGSERTQTLIGLALFLPDCYPSQDYLAKVLGVSRTTANQRVKKLLNFQYKGKSIIEVRKYRSEKGRFGSNEYHFRKISGVSIF